MTAVRTFKLITGCLLGSCWLGYSNNGRHSLKQVIHITGMNLIYIRHTCLRYEHERPKQQGLKENV